MEQHLATTNLLLGIIAAVSALEGCLIIGIGLGAFFVYRRTMAAISLLHGVEERQIAPLMARVHAVVDDVKCVTATAREETERVDQAVRATIDRIDETAGRVRSVVRWNTNRVVSVLRGVAAAFDQAVASHPTAKSARRV